MLNESLIRTIRDRYEKLKNDGKLLSPQQIEQYRTTFRRSFGPDVLAGLDGELLQKIDPTPCESGRAFGIALRMESVGRGDDSKTARHRDSGGDHHTIGEGDRRSTGRL